jgi:CRP-like cAMP-binding protein
MQDSLFDFIAQYVQLDAAEKNALLSLDLFHSFKKGTVLLREGQTTNKNFFVLKGCIRVYYLLDGEEKTTSFYTEMEGIAPHCVLSKTPSTYYIGCVEDSILVISDDETSAKMNAQFPKFETICRMLSEELLAKQQIDFDAFKTSSPEERYRHLLENRPDLIQRVPQHQLASYLGIQPQSLSRLRARMLEKKR